MQTDFAQSLKWDPARFEEVLRVNLELARDAFGRPQTPALVVLPRPPCRPCSTASPLAISSLRRPRQPGRGDLVMGAFRRDAEERIYNAAISLGSAPVQLATPSSAWCPSANIRRHVRLVLRAGDPDVRPDPRRADQQPMRFGDQQVALNICYGTSSAPNSSARPAIR